MYTEFVNSLKRLYEDKKITQEHIKKLLRFNKISKEEYEFILGKE